MKKHSLKYSETGFFPDLILNYLEGKASVQDFYQFPVSIEGFQQKIEDRKNFPFHREELAGAISEQCSALDLSDKSQQNIELLRKENTFTITTGHQLNLFTGPLYFIYKIISVINLAERLKKEFPENSNPIMPQVIM